MIQPGRPQLSAKPREVCPVVLADARAGAYGRSTTAFHRRTRNSNANRHRPARYQSTIYRNVGLRHKHCKQEAKRLQYDPTTGRRPLSPVNKFRWGLFLGAKQSHPRPRNRSVATAIEICRPLDLLALTATIWATPAAKWATLRSPGERRILRTERKQSICLHRFQVRLSEEPLWIVEDSFRPPPQ
jgi:hypothetical protein